MLFGKKVHYCLTYKINMPTFEIYSPRRSHGFRIQHTSEDLEGAEGLELDLYNVFIIFKKNQIRVYDSSTLEITDRMEVELMKTESREPNEIIGMTKSPNQEFIALITGKNLIKLEKDTNQLFIFRVLSEGGTYTGIDLLKEINIKGIPELDKTCMKFHFMQQKTGWKYDSLLIAKKDSIIAFNFMTEEIKVIH